jgi:TolB-like protein
LLFYSNIAILEYLDRKPDMKTTRLVLTFFFVFASVYQKICARANDTEGGKETLSVLYFDNITKDREYDWLSKGITDMLISDIMRTGMMDVIERTNLKKILDEQALSQSHLADDTRALALGKLLSATKLIYGSFIVRGNIIIINSKITATESGKILSAFSVRGPAESLLSLQDELSVKIKSALGMKDSISHYPAAQYPLEAVKKYYQGLDLLDMGAVEDARRKFGEAAAIDPYYIKPYQGIEESYKFLKNFTRMRQQREINSLYEKVNRLQARLKEKPWRTFADIAVDPRYQELRRNNSALYEKEVFAYSQGGETPAVCTWNLQNNIAELAGLYEEYFEDTSSAVNLYNEVIRTAERSRKLFAKDPFLPEILYQAVLSCSYLEKWADLKQRCEELMNNYSDYRMMWAVEDFYKKSLEKLAEKK